jgi:hypothetical protein
LTEKCVPNTASNQHHPSTESCKACEGGQLWWPCGVIGDDGKRVCLGKAGTCAGR